MPAQASCCLPASWLVLWVAAVAMGAAEVAEFITIALQPYTAGMQPTQAQPRRQLQLQSNRTTTRDGWSGPDLPGPLFILVRSYTPAAWNLRLGYALPAGRFLIQPLTQTSDFVYPLRAQSLPTYRKIYIDKYCTCVLTFRVIVSRHSRRTFPSFSPRSHSHFGSHPNFTPAKIAPFFSCTYQLQISQPFYFDIHAKCPGCTTSPRCILERFCPVPCLIPFVFTFLRTLLHVFALTKNSTRLFSIDSALFAKKKTARWGAAVSSNLQFSLIH